jgi:hypothetical protein
MDSEVVEGMSHKVTVGSQRELRGSDIQRNTELSVVAYLKSQHLGDCEKMIVGSRIAWVTYCKILSQKKKQKTNKKNPNPGGMAQVVRVPT